MSQETDKDKKIHVLCEKILNNQDSDAELLELKQLIASKNSEIFKYLANVGEDNNIIIGNQTYKGIDAEKFRKIIEIILEEVKRLVNTGERLTESGRERLINRLILLLDSTSTYRFIEYSDDSADSWGLAIATGLGIGGGGGIIGDIKYIGNDDDYSAPITRDSDIETEIYQNSNLQLRRYPNIDCSDKVILNQRFSVTIELLLNKPEVEYGSALSIEDTGTEDLPNVEVVLSHSGFDIEDSNTQIMEIKRDDDSSVRFILISRNIGQKKIKASFYQNGKPIGKAIRNILVSEQLISVDVSQPDQLGEIEVKTVLTVPPQDLELYIDLADDNRTLSFGLHSVKENINYHRNKLGQVILKGSPIEKIQSIYKEVILLAQKMPTSAEDKAWAEHRLESIGNQLWDELIPEQLKQEYWKFKSNVTSVLITSEEPWIPWEMIKPYRHNDDGEEENSLFWCQQFAISRWLSGCGTADNLDMKTGRSIAPIETNLPAVKEEVAFLEKLSDLRANFMPLTTFSYREQVLDSLKNEDLSIFHFACHGVFDSNSPNNSAIKLSGGPLCPSDIRVSFGGKRQRPLIFMNACHGSQAEFSFTGLGGWAKLMVDARVGAFIGPMWEVNDKLALEFAKTFYTALLQEDKTFAESFRQAREKIRQLAPYNSTWLAYTLYADPEGKVKT